jgi:hypothetical protein
MGLRLGGDDLGTDAQGRQHHDVHLRVPQEPEQVLEEDGAAPHLVQRLAADVDIAEVETGAHQAVHEQQHHRAHQHREGQDAHHGREQEAQIVSGRRVIFMPLVRRFIMVTT